MSDDSLVLSTGHFLERLTPGGRLDRTFGEGGSLTPPAPPGGEFEIDGLAVDSQNRIVVAGTFHRPQEDISLPPGVENVRLEGTDAARVLRYLPSGALDPSFGAHGVVETDFGLPAPKERAGNPFLPTPSVEVSGVTVDSEDRVILTGGASTGLEFGCAHDWTFYALTYSAFVARLTGSGEPDTGFGGGDGVFGGRDVAENPLHAEVVTRPRIGVDGELSVASRYGHCPRTRGSAGLLLLTPAGELSTSFGTRGAARVWSTEGMPASDGSIGLLGFVVPWFPEKEPARAVITRLRPSGELDRAYGRGGHAVIKTPGGPGGIFEAMAIDQRGRVLLGGTTISTKTFASPSGGKRRHWFSFVMVRLGSHGHLDRAFGPHGRVVTKFSAPSVNASGLLVDSKGRAIMVGTKGRSYPAKGLVVARYLIDR